MFQHLTLSQIKAIISNSTIDTTSNNIIITDSNIYNLYPDLFTNLTLNKIIVINGNRINEIKNISTLFKIINKMLHLEVSKNSHIIAIGGGSICDLTGFIASIYMRGIDVYFIPTTLLAMADASIGGKNGVDVRGVKNLFGTLYEPTDIYICTDFLTTLDKNTFMSGMAEIFKIGFLFDADLINKIENYLLNSYDKSLLNTIINTAILLKKNVIKQDYFSKNIRHTLNFGHTLGHIIETKYNLQHGFAIALGMVEETRLAVKLGFTDINVFNQIKKIIDSYYPIQEFDLSDIYQKLIFDKKVKNNKTITMPIIKSFGNYELVDIELSKIIFVQQEHIN